jgi:hypothetical protein
MGQVRYAPNACFVDALLAKLVDEQSRDDEHVFALLIVLYMYRCFHIHSHFTCLYYCIP